MTFLHLPVNPLIILLLYTYICSCILKCPKIYQLNIIMKIKKDCRKKAREGYSNFSKEEKGKQATIWL